MAAIAEALLWLINEAPDDGETPAHIRFDSYYAANITRGMWQPKFNEELAKRTAEIYETASQRRTITWEHVYGHTGELDNETADRAADFGAKGRVSSCSRRWCLPPPPAPEDNREMDMCRRCGVEMPARELKWHLRRCTSEAWVIPLGFDKCRKCKQLLRRPEGSTKNRRAQHESECRGSDLLNRTCGKCGKVFEPEDNPANLCRTMLKHEAKCGGSGTHVGKGSGKAQVTVPVPVPVPAPTAKAKAKAKVKAEAKGKAKAKGKASAKPKAKAIPKTGARPHRRPAYG